MLTRVVIDGVVVAGAVDQRDARINVGAAASSFESTTIYLCSGNQPRIGGNAYWVLIESGIGFVRESGRQDSLESSLIRARSHKPISKRHADVHDTSSQV